MTGLVATVALLAGIVALLGWWRSARRARVLEARVARLEREVHDDLLPVLDDTRRETEAASRAARMATQAVGIEDPPPRLAGEAFTGPVVRAVAFGAGARRALTRVASEITPLAKTRARTVKVVSTATRVTRATAPASRRRRRDDARHRTKRNAR